MMSADALKDEWEIVADKFASMLSQEAAAARSSAKPSRASPTAYRGKSLDAAGRPGGSGCSMQDYLHFIELSGRRNRGQRNLPGRES
jgi:hypothetical protein